MKFRLLCMTVLCCLFNICHAQQLELTKDGFRSSADLTLPYVEYSYSDGGESAAENYFKDKEQDINFLEFTFENYKPHKWRVKGYWDSSKLVLANGKSEIPFEYEVEFSPASVKISCELLTSKGKPYDYSFLFKKKSGKVRSGFTNSFIEDQANTFIQKVLEDQIVIK